MDQNTQLGFRRQVLLLVSDRLPCALTQTLHSLLSLEPHSYPTEIYLLTTPIGLERFRCTDQTRFKADIDRLAQCMNMRRGRAVSWDLNEKHLLCFESHADNRGYHSGALHIMEILQELCTDSQCCVHVHIGCAPSGLGMLVGHALSIFGRSQDRLTLVDVSSVLPIPELSMHSDQCSFKDVQLTEFPLFKVRSGLIEKVLSGELSCEQSLQKLHTPINAPIQVSFNLRQRCVLIGDKTVKLPPVPFVVYLWMMHLHTQGALPGLPGHDLTLESFLSVCRQVFSRYSATYENIVSTTKTPEFFLQFFREKRSIINNRLKKRLGAAEAEPYLIQSNGRRLHIQYRLGIDRNQIDL